tara:strand:- start:233 stop:1375 length:1143 start_codon:yes stop_codon:yes gene_type:complete
MALTKISRGLLDTGVSDSSDATAITISSSEQVMIGTTDAGYPDYGDSLTVADVDGGGGNAGMTIRSGTSSYGTFYFSDATGTAAGTYAGKMQYNHSNNSMVFGTNSADRLTIDSSGNVGIGITNPSDYYSEQLVVNAEEGEGGITIKNATDNNGYLMFADGTSGSEAYRGYIMYGHSVDEMRLYTSTYMNFYSNGSERMRLTSGGDFLVGKTVTTLSTAGIHMQGSTGRTLCTVSGDNVMDLNRTTSNGVILGFYLNGSSVGTISTNTHSLPSDKNFKRDISDLDLGLNLVTKLKPSQYNYKIDSEDCPKMYGLIAQDLEESLTEVGVEKNSTWLLQHEPKDDEKQSDYSLDYTKLIPILINSIQELSAKVEELESKINE